jgi:uncharacterized protein with gpF-like domain
MNQDDLFSPVRRIEEQYRRSLNSLSDEFIRIARSIPIADPFKIVDILRAFSETSWFVETAYSIASRMVTASKVDNANSWKEAASQSSRGRMIYAALRSEVQGPVGMAIRDLIDQNARLISTFPLDVAEKANRFILEESQKGRRAADIADDLMHQFPDVARGRIKLIARTEVSKASTALTRVRSEALNLPWYVWKSSKDVRVRPSHRFLAKEGGCLIHWNDPPLPEALIGVKTTLTPAHAGEFPNCRCYCAPVLDLDNLPWAHRLYRNGSVRMVTRSQFEKIAGTDLMTRGLGTS